VTQCTSQPTPAVSIILPTYNRAKFLRQAFSSIQSQRLTDWELIVVDDGSTDDTRQLVAECTRCWSQPVRYIHQDNRGPYGARNTGLDAVRGAYVAFFDSDDLWLPHHLEDCVRALETSPEVDWVYAACRILELGTERELAPSTFYVDGQPRPFLQLKGRDVGPLWVIEDADVVRCQILHGLYAGLQNSVIRRRVFDDYRFRTRWRNEAEDQVVLIRSLVAGYRVGYLNRVHVLYRIHADNSSGSALDAPLEKRLRIQEALVAGFEDMRREVPLDRRQRRALEQRLASTLFWRIGYALLWQSGHTREALEHFRQGLRRWPWDWRFWKVYLLARTRVALGVACPARSH
jgi:glycosyltransferase involved in cell wall biosynthesis